MNLKDATLKLERYNALYEAETSRRVALENKRTALEGRSENIALAVKFVQSTAERLQSNVTGFLTQCVQAALDIVFPGAYGFQMEFGSRRNQTELDLYLVRNGEKVDPMSAAGGGVVDVISFALQVCCLLLSGKRKVLILDEPFKFIRGEARDALGSLLTLLSAKSGVQVIMVADVAGEPVPGSKHFKVSIDNGVSSVLEEM